MKQLIAAYQKDDLGTFMKMLAVLAAASALFTYSGASLDAETFLGKARATVLAIGGATAIYMFWKIALRVVPEMRSPKQKTIALSIVGLGCSLIFWLSSAFNVAGLAGEEALELHLSRYVAGLEDAVDAQFRHALLIESVAADIRVEIARYEAAAEDEFKSGTYSGSNGPGAVVNALGGIKGRLLSLRDEADNFIASLGKHRTQAQTRLETIRKIATSGKPLLRRMRDIATESDLLRSDLAQMDARNMAESVSRTLEALPREVTLHASFSKNSNVAQRQKRALEHVREDIEQSAGVLGAFISSATTSAPPGVKAFEKVSAVRAVVIHWENYLPFWAGGIALDIAPLALVVFLMIAMNTKSKAELAHSDIMMVRIEDLIRAKLGEEALGQMGIDPESLKAINNGILGRENEGDDSNKGADE